jgi:hypothetical protein
MNTLSTSIGENFGLVKLVVSVIGLPHRFHGFSGVSDPHVNQN